LNGNSEKRRHLWELAVAKATRRRAFANWNDKVRNADMQSNASATAARRNNQKRSKETSNEIPENPRVRVTIDGIQESSAGPINSSFPPSISHFPVVWHTENAAAVDSLFARIRKKLFFSPVKMFPRIDLCSFRFGRDHGRAVYLHHASKREILISEVRTRVDIDITRDEMWILITGEGKKKKKKRKEREEKCLNVPQMQYRVGLF